MRRGGATLEVGFDVPSLGWRASQVLPEWSAFDHVPHVLPLLLHTRGHESGRLYPGLVRTEKVMEAAQWLDLSNSESPEFIGPAVAALAADPDVLRHTGKVLVAAALAEEYGFTDVDGTTPRPLTLADV